MHEPDIEATARRDVPSLRVRRPARLDRDLGDVELDIHGAAGRLPSMTTILLSEAWSPSLQLTIARDPIRGS